jgi:hypothetical protein
MDKQESKIISIIVSIIVVILMYGTGIGGIFSHTIPNIILGFTIGTMFPLILFITYKHKFARKV